MVKPRPSKMYSSHFSHLGKKTELWKRPQKAKQIIRDSEGLCRGNGVVGLCMFQLICPAAAGDSHNFLPLPARGQGRSHQVQLRKQRTAGPGKYL